MYFLRIFITSITMLLLISSHGLSNEVKDVKDVLFISDPWPPFTIGEDNKEAEGGLLIELKLMVRVKFNLRYTASKVHNLE